MARKVSFVLMLGILAVFAAGAFFYRANFAPRTQSPVIPEPRNDAERIAAAALDQTTWGTIYDPSYVRIGYPNGDVPRDRGVCTDVVIRAFRSIKIDLQKAIHEDAKRSKGNYPRIFKLDSNIDHRRCPNQIIYFQKFAQTKSIKLDQNSKSDWMPGDIVFWKLPGGKDHVGILSFSRNSSGLPLVVHNIGRGPLEEDVLAEWTLVARFRWPSDPRAR